MYEYRTRIRYTEIQEDGRISLLGLLNYLQNVSEFHSLDSGMSLEYYKNARRAWFICYWDIRIDRLPHEGEYVVAGTSPHNVKGVFAGRNFWLRSDGGNVNDGKALADAARDFDSIIRADSAWFMVDTDTVRPVRIRESDIAPFGEPEDVLGLGVKVRKIALPKEARLKPAGTRTVTYDMLDSNHHVNNIRYIAAAYDALMESGLADRGYYPHRIRAEYKNAAKLGDTFCFDIWHDDINAVWYTDIHSPAVAGTAVTDYCVVAFE